MYLLLASISAENQIFLIRKGKKKVVINKIVNTTMFWWKIFVFTRKFQKRIEVDVLYALWTFGYNSECSQLSVVLLLVPNNMWYENNFHIHFFFFKKRLSDSEIELKRIYSSVTTCCYITQDMNVCINLSNIFNRRITKL